jgi:penicillin-binding protein 1A
VLQDWQAFTIRDILRDNVLGGTGGNASGVDDAAGKTGTTDDSKDAWFCGMTPELTACVWMGYNTPTPMPGAAGGGTPTIIWASFMKDALDHVKDQEWWEPKGTPTWLPWTANKWQTSLGLDVEVGSSTPTKPAGEATDDKDTKDDAADPGGTGTTPEPTTPEPTTPEPTTPAPTTPEPVTPEPAPTALVRRH